MDTSKPITPERVINASSKDIARLTTRHLHTLYKRWRLTSEYLRCSSSWYTPYPEEKAVLTAVEMLKTELNRRPHIPNKLEGKNNRRLAAKAKR